MFKRTKRFVKKLAVALILIAIELLAWGIYSRHQNYQVLVTILVMTGLFLLHGIAFTITESFDKSKR